MSESLTRSLGSFVSELRLAAIPADALSVVHTGFADCVGTMIAGSVEDPPKILHKALAPPAGRCQPLPGRPARAGARGGLDQRHGRACARLRRRGAARPPERRAGAGHPGRGPVAQGERRADGDGLRRGLRGLGRPAAPRSATAPREGLASHGHLRRHRRGGGLRVPARPRCREGHHRHCARRLAERRPGVELRHHDQALPRRTFRACGRHRRAPGGRRLHRLARRAGAPAGLPRRRLAQGQCRPQLGDAGRARLGDPHPGPQREEVSAVLLHAPGHRRRARPAARPEDRARRRQGDHRLDQPAQHQDPPQQPAADRARGQVQHAVRHGERDRGQARRARRADRRASCSARTSRR